MAERKNAATLSNAERDAFLNAVLELKKTVLTGHTLNIYDEFVAIHLGVTSLRNGPAAFIDGAHGGPAFLPWHREYILRYEQALQNVDPNVSLPYWNWGYGSASETNTLFQDNFMGPAGSGGASSFDVMSGYFALNPNAFNPNGWQIHASLRPSSLGSTLQRLSTLNPSGLPDSTTLDNVLGQTIYSDFRPDLESPHGSVHVWVGRNMMAMTSPNDPIFFMHHANVDRLWAIWQQTHPGAANYNPGGTGGVGHKIDDQMWPWDGGQSAPNATLNSLLPSFPSSDIRTPRDVLDHTALGYTYDTDPISTPTPTPTPTSGSGWCFVATATVGGFNHPTVVLLSEFRDKWLLKRKWGQWFVKCYYEYGHYPAKAIRKSKWLRKACYHMIIKPLSIIVKVLLNRYYTTENEKRELPLT